MLTRTLITLLLASLSHSLFAETTPAEVALGERLFLETRFAQSYFSDPASADPQMQTTATTAEPLANPFRGQHINCRSCHLVDEHLNTPGAGMRSYADFAPRTPIQQRQDAHKTTTRNSQQLVGSALPRSNGVLLHFDGEFASTTDLVKATLTGRNYGWLTTEGKTARKHIAKIIRNDNGKTELAKEFGGAYREVLKGQSAIDNVYLPAEYRLDVNAASDAEILHTIATLISAYLEDIVFSQDENGEYNASPYDHFLAANNLPRQPNKGESDQVYSERLINAIKSLRQPVFITDKKKTFTSHQQAFRFAKQELEGLKHFFNKNTGNCISCHSAPHFTDFNFHNTGITQKEYDKIHGSNAFNKLVVPELGERNRNVNQYLPATEKHPHASERFRQIASVAKPGYTDLGLWNIFANPDVPAPQEKIRALLCNKDKPCEDSKLLKSSLARFKTPSLRDLGHSQPYMHNGSLLSLNEVVSHYLTSAVLQKQGLLRNGAPELAPMTIDQDVVDKLVAFLNALNEDYE